MGFSSSNRAYFGGGTNLPNNVAGNQTQADEVYHKDEVYDDTSSSFLSAKSSVSSEWKYEEAKKKEPAESSNKNKKPEKNSKKASKPKSIKIKIGKSSEESPSKKPKK